MDGHGDFHDIVATCTRREDMFKFQDACREYVRCRIGEVSQEQFDAVFDYSWDRGHSSGYHEVASVLDDILDIVVAFTRVKNEA